MPAQPRIPPQGQRLGSAETPPPGTPSHGRLNEWGYRPSNEALLIPTIRYSGDDQDSAA